MTDRQVADLKALLATHHIALPSRTLTARIDQMDDGWAVKLDGRYLVVCESAADAARWLSAAFLWLSTGLYELGYQAGLEQAAQLVCPVPHVEEERTCAEIAAAIRARKG